MHHPAHQTSKKTVLFFGIAGHSSGASIPMGEGSGEGRRKPRSRPTSLWVGEVGDRCKKAGREVHVEASDRGRMLVRLFLSVTVGNGRGACVRSHSPHRCSAVAAFGCFWPRAQAFGFVALHFVGCRVVRRRYFVVIWVLGWSKLNGALGDTK